MNIEQMLANPLVETFIIEGEAATFEGAHRQAWNAVERAAENGDIDPQWNLKVMQHVANGRGGVQFHAEFVRRPDEEV